MTVTSNQKKNRLQAAAEELRMMINALEERSVTSLRHVRSALYEIECSIKAVMEDQNGPTSDT